MLARWVYLLVGSGCLRCSFEPHRNNRKKSGKTRARELHKSSTTIHIEALIPSLPLDNMKKQLYLKGLEFIEEPGK